MLAMLLLALWTVLQRPYESSLWATFAARWLVPFVLYQLAQAAFCDSSSLRQFETFCLTVLAYLSAISIAFLIGAHWLIFPGFILDEGLGIHAERARGPFLQAVANGVTLNLLGLLALNAFRRGRLRGWVAWLLLASLPLAILATKTRSIWLSFSTSILLLPLVSRNRRLRGAAVALVIAGGLTVITTLSFSEARTALADRFGERSPVEFRESMYRAGWEMFLERPLWGWNANDVQPELAQRITDFKLDSFVFHNTYLDVAVSNGVFGLAIYLWLFIDLLRLGRTPLDPNAGTNSFLDLDFRALWPVFVAVYVINASFVLMHYQFVNALLFTLAGMLAAQNRRTADHASLAALSQRGTSYA
jgi:O-antigen ligase